MNGYAVDYAPRANQDVNSLSPDVGVRVAKKILQLETNPHPRGDTVRRLQGRAQQTYRLRIGDYRAIFEIDEDAHRVAVLRIVHRSQLDRALRELL